MCSSMSAAFVRTGAAMMAMVVDAGGDGVFSVRPFVDAAGACAAECC